MKHVLLGAALRSSKNRRERQAAHDKATEAWIEAGGVERARRSRTAGLGEMLRSKPRPQRPASERKRVQEQHKARLRRIREQAVAPSLVWTLSKLDRSRYFPHQGERERSRGVQRQVLTVGK